MLIPDQMKEYLEFCKHKNKALETNEMDLSKCTWMYPTTLLPLLSFLREHKDIQLCLPKNRSVASYIETVRKNHATKPDTFVPFIDLPLDVGKSQEVVDQLYKLNNDGKEYGGEVAFKYVIGELMDNIYQHSHFTSAFIMAQQYKTKGFVEICLFDNGITIPGSLEKAGLKFGPEEHEIAIEKAINGLSAKRDTERGRGLSTNVDLVTNGLNGLFLVISGNGAAFLSKNKPILFKLQKPNSLSGTLVSIRIKYPAEGIYVYDFIE